MKKISDFNAKDEKEKDVTFLLKKEKKIIYNYFSFGKFNLKCALRIQTNLSVVNYFFYRK